MIAILVAALTLQAAVQVKPVWTLGPSIDREGNGFPIGNLTRRRSQPNFIMLVEVNVDRSLTKGTQQLFKLDAGSGVISSLAILSWTREGTPENPNDTKFSIGPTGELLREHWDGIKRTFTVLDPDTLDLLYTLSEGLNGTYKPESEPSVTSSILFPGRFQFSSVGDVTILSDGPHARIAINNYEVNSYVPGSWQLKSRLLKKGDLTSRIRPFLDLQIKGDPQSGTFALSNGSSSAFFHGDERLSDIPDTVQPMDAGPNGFLVINKPTPSSSSLACLDPESGEVIWTRQDLLVGNRPVNWVGKYAVTMGRNEVERSGKMVHKLLVLDGQTGKTVAETILPINMEMWEIFGADGIVILTDDQNKYYGYRIEAKS